MGFFLIVFYLDLSLCASTMSHITKTMTDGAKSRKHLHRYELVARQTNGFDDVKLSAEKLISTMITFFQISFKLFKRIFL